MGPDLKDLAIVIRPMNMTAWLLRIVPQDYWVRLVASSSNRRSEHWTLGIDEEYICVCMHNAIILDPQNRGPEFEPRVSSSPIIQLDREMFVSVVGDHHGYHVPLPRGCSLYFERKTKRQR